MYAIIFDQVQFQFQGKCGETGSTAFMTVSSNVYHDSPRWHHVVLTCTPSNSSKIYVDGVLEGTSTSSLYAMTLSILYIGNWQTGWITNGSLDDIGIWNRALSQQEITSLYSAVATGIIPTSSEGKFEIYPNPSSDELRVNVDANMLNGLITITDITGKKMTEEKINEEKSIIKLTDYKAGLYFVQLIIDNQKWSTKFIKQ